MLLTVAPAWAQLDRILKGLGAGPVGQEERKIRTDPTARVTELLKEVFGK